MNCTHHRRLVESLADFRLGGRVWVDLELLPDYKDGAVEVKSRHVSVGCEADVTVTVTAHTKVLDDTSAVVVQS